MAIEETIAVGVTGLGEVTALADGLDKAAAAAARLDEAAGKGFSFSGAAAGADKLAASYEAAFAKISAQADAMGKRMADLGKIGGDASAAGLAAMGDAGKSAAAGLDSAAASASGLGAELKGVSGAGDSAAAGLAGVGDAGKSAAGGLDAAAASAGAAGDAIKGIGGGADASAVQLAEFNKVMADSAKVQRDTAAVSADANAKIALGQRLNTTAARDASAEAAAAQRAQSASAKQAAADAEASSSKHGMVVLGLAAALGYGVDKAAQLQTAVTRLYTSAGEQQKNLPMITQGILGMSGPTNTSQSQLASGTYWAESAGFHGRNALAVDKAAAEGAQAEGAEMPDVANALTTTLNDYFGGPQKSSAVQGKQAMTAMNEIIGAVGQGKMTLQGLSGAMPFLLPASKQAGLQLPQALGAEATMTSQGISAQESAQLLKHTIGALQKPSNIQSAEMQMLGINPVQLSHDLGKQGLTGTIGEVDDAIRTHMGPGGMVLLDTMNQSKLAVQSANLEIAKMPASIQGTAKAYLSGSISAKAFNQAVRQGPESAVDANLLKQFEGTAGTALGFSSLIKSGLGNKQTQAAALSALMGGQEGSQVGLALGGEHMKTFRANVDQLGQSAAHTGSNIRGWSDVQSTLNFKIGSFTKTLEALAAEAGGAALPAATTVLKGLTGAAGFLASNPEIAKPAMAAGGVLAAGYAVQKISQPVTTALQGVGKVAETLHIPGLDKLATVGTGASQAAGAGPLTSAAGSLDGSASALEGAAASLEGAAGSLKAGAALPGKTGAPVPVGAAESAAEKDAATAGEEGIGAGFLSKFLGGAKTALGGLPELAGRMVWPMAIAATAKGIGDQLAPAGSKAGGATSIAQHSSLAGPSGALDIGGFFGILAQHMPAFLTSAAGAVFDHAGTAPRQPSLAGSGAGFRVAGPQSAARPWNALPPAPVPAPPAAESQMPHMYSAMGHPGTMTGGLTPAKIPAPDLSAIEGASAKVKAALQNISQVSIKPAKVPAPDMSGVDAAKAKAMSAAQGITQAIQSPLSRPAHAAAPDLAAFAAARGPAQSDGANISAGLAAGIESEKGAVTAAAADVAGAAAAAMSGALKTHSPSKVTEVTGEETSAGLAVGLASGKSKAKVKSAAITITQATVNSLVTGLQGGQSAVDAAMSALGKSTAKPADIASIEATVAKLKTDLAAGLKKHDVSKSEDSALTAMLNRDNTRLQGLAAQRDKLVTEIGDSQQIAQAAVSGASIMNAGSALPPEATPAQAASQTIQGMQYQAQQQKQFAGDIAQLKKQGLNAQSLNQIVQAGAGSGDPVAQGILQGGKGAVKQLNQLQSQITAAAGQLGDEGAPVMYQAGQQLAGATGQGLKAQLSKVQNEMKQIAKGMTAAVQAGVGGKGLDAAMRAAGQSAGAGFAQGIAAEQAAAAAAAAQLAQAAAAAAKAALKSKSPSLIFTDIGLSVPQGFAAGVWSGQPLVAAAIGAMASGAGSAARTGMMQPYGGGGTYGAGSHGGGTQVVHHHYSISVQGAVVAGARDLLDTVQDMQLVRAANNWQGGLSMAGRRP